MSNRFLNVIFGADTSGFSKGVNQVRSELTQLNVAMSQNKKKQGELKKEIKDLEKQQKDLKKVMSEVKTPTKEMAAEAEKLQRALDKATLQSAELKTEEQELKAKIKDTTKELNDQVTASKKNAVSMEQLADGLKKAAKLTATGMAALFTYTAKMGASADEINTLSKQTGLATNEIQKFMYASELIDVSLETLTGSMSKLVRNMNNAAKGTGDAYEAFKVLGVSVKDDVTGVLRDNQDVFDEVISKLGTIEDTTQRDAYAMAIFGKSAQELNPLILGGTEQLKALGDELEREGLILDQMQLDKLNEFNDKIDTFKAKFQAKSMESSVDWVDAFDELLDESDEIVEFIATLITGFARITGVVVDHKEAVIALVVAYGTFKTVMAIGNIIHGVIEAVQSLTSATKGATIAQKGMNAAVSAHPYVMLASVIASVASAFITYNAITESTTEKTNELIGSTDRLKKSIEDAEISTEAEVTLIKKKAERYEELRNKLKLTAQEEQELYNIASELESLYPNEIKLIDNKTQAYIEMGTQIDVLTEKMLINARTAAQQSALSDAYVKLYDLEYEIKDTKDRLVEAEDYVADMYSTDEPHSPIVEAVSYLDYRRYFNKDYKEFFEEKANLKSLEEEKESILECIEELEGALKDAYSKGFSAGDDGGDKLDNWATDIKTLYENYTVLTSAEKEFNKEQQLSLETLELITSKYPELQGVVNDYIAGLATGEDVINRLEMAYNNDVKKHQTAVEEKANTNENFYRYLRQINDSYLSTLATQYGIDLRNYQNYSQAKLDIEKAFLSTKAKNWAKYYDAESNTYKITQKDLMQLKKELRASGMSEAEVNEAVSQYKSEFQQTQAAVFAWNNLANTLDGELKNYVDEYSPVLSFGNSSSSSSSSTSSKKEISVYEQAKASFAKLIEDRMNEIRELTDAETAAADERIAAIEKEIDARKKLSETDDLQKRIDFLRGQLKYSQLDDFERYELEKQLKELTDQQEEESWEAAKRDEIEAIKAESEKIKSENDAIIEDLQNRLNYGNTLFTDLQNGYKSATTIANNNSKTANITIVEKAMTQGQVTQLVKDSLGIEVIF